MAKPSQLILNESIELPYVSRGKYSANRLPLEVSKRTIGGRLVTERRGFYWVIRYTNDYIGNDLMRTLMAALRSGTVAAEFLTPDWDSTTTGMFKCTQLPSPQAAFSRGGVLLWNNVAFTLEAVEAMN